MASLIQRTAQKTKNKGKLKTKTEYSPEETVRAIVHEGSPLGRSETMGGRICETGRF